MRHDRVTWLWWRSLSQACGLHIEKSQYENLHVFFSLENCIKSPNNEFSLQTKIIRFYLKVIVRSNKQLLFYLLIVHQNLNSLTDHLTQS